MNEMRVLVARRVWRICHAVFFEPAANETGDAVHSRETKESVRSLQRHLTIPLLDIIRKRDTVQYRAVLASTFALLLSGVIIEMRLVREVICERALERGSRLHVVVACTVGDLVV